jgi:two-component system sensor histidine kinase TctE
VVLAPLDLNALALEVATTWVPEALERHIDLGFEGAEGPVSVRGDAVRLRELLDNLVDNAVRYSPAGGRVTVKVSGAPAPTVQVSDDGPAIPAEHRQRIFERFHRLLGTAAGGSGLGLAIAREIAHIHGASVELRDDPGATGNTFAVTFPA